MSLSESESSAPLWFPSEHRRSSSHLAELLARYGFENYDEAWNWSVSPATMGEFWRGVADEAQVTWHRGPLASLEVDARAVTGVRWFRGGTLNYAELALRRGGDTEAIIAYDDARGPRAKSWREW